MPNKLHDLIARQIELSGPLSVSAYMDICLSHPEYGYYRTRDPLGRDGDFITAPEVSQLFGEMIGIWIVDIWMKLGEPPKIILCEMGPGWGTLMADIIRVLSKAGVKASIHLVETGEVLRAKQKQVIANAEWHSALENVPSDAPIIIIGNEFLDALPLRQLIKTKEGWRERVIGVENGKLVFGIGAGPYSLDIPDAKDGDIFEFSPVREHVWSDICARVRAQKGAALMIDYGYTETRTGTTFQAVQNHAYADVLENPGEQDLTSHVDFARLKELAKGLAISGPLTQGEFLKSLGIEIRAQKLSGLNPDKAESINAGLKRLIHRDEMGQLFKAIHVSNL